MTIRSVGKAACAALLGAALLAGMQSAASAEEATAAEATVTEATAAEAAREEKEARQFTPLPVDDSPGPVAAEENYRADGLGYEDESLSVRIETMRAYETEIMLAHVKVADPSQIRTAMAARYGSRKEAKPRVMAERVHSVFCVNGDFFSYRPTGYLVRQGVLYRDKVDPDYDILIIDDKGDFHILKDPTEEAVKAFEGTIVNTFNFGPALVMDGEKVLPVKMMDSGSAKPTQRMAACQTGPLSYLFVATEGPENKGSVGLTLEQMVELCASLGVEQAYNLDGGSSSAMLLNLEKLNALSTRKIRPICDILYFATLIPAEEEGL